MHHKEISQVLQLRPNTAKWKNNKKGNVKPEAVIVPLKIFLDIFVNYPELHFCVLKKKKKRVQALVNMMAKNGLKMPSFIKNFKKLSSNLQL